MKIGRWLVAGVGFLAAALAGPAAAQDDRGLYLGGSVGYAQYKDVCIQTANVPCDDNDSAWRGFAGYQFNRYVGGEFGYADLGAVKGNGIISGTPFTGSFEQEVTAFDLSLVLSAPIAGGLSAHGRVGAYRARTTLDQDGTFPGAPLHDAGTNTGFTYGAGVGFTLWRIGLRAEWQRYENVGASKTGEADIDVFSVGALIRF